MASTLASAEAIVSPASLRPSREVALTASLLAVACVLGLVEASMPGLPVAPWLRLGLANIAVVVAFAVGTLRTAGIVSLGRVVLVALATGSLFTPTFAMATAGAVASLAAMWGARRLISGLSPAGWSAAGSAAHVLGQFAAAAALLGTGSVIALAPPSVLVSLAFGAVVGSLAQLAVSRISMGQARL